MPLNHPSPALRHPKISLRMADGGQVHPWSIKGMVGRAQAAMTDTPEQAAHKAGLAEYKARASAERSAPAAPAPQTAAPMGSQTVIDRRMAAAGLQDGGEVPGEGKGDKIPAMYEPGEFVVSNDMLKARPSLRAELQDLREGVLNAQGRSVEEADANAIKMDGKGPSLRALDGFGILKSINDATKTYGQPLPGSGMMPIGNPNPGWTNDQSPKNMAQTGPAPTSGAPSGSAGGDGGAPVAGVSSGSGRPLTDDLMPSLRRAGAEVGKDISNKVNSGNYAGAAGATVLGAGKYIKAAADDVIGGFARGAYGLLRNPVEDAGRGALGLEDRKEPPAPALPTPQQAAPRPSLRAAAPSAAEAPATAAPEANVNVTRQANGVLSFSGKNIKGDVTYGGPEGGSLRSSPIGVVPGMDQRAIDSTLNNPNGTRWSSNDNAIMAANIRDGVDPYRGTSRGQNTGDPAMQQMEALATSPVGTPGRNGAIRALIAMKGDQTARRGQDMTYDESMTGARATMESNRARLRQEFDKDQRDFKMRSEDQAFKQRGDADKNLTAELEAQFTTRGKDGASEVDRNAVAEHKAAITAHLGGLIAAAEKRGDAATVEALRSQGAAALGKGEVQKLVSQLEAKKRIAASHGNMPWSGTFVDSADPSGYDVTGIKKGITQDQYTFRNGSTAPTRVLDYSQGGSNFLPNGLTDTRTTRFDNIKSLRQE